MSVRSLCVLLMWVVLSAAVARAEPVDRSKMLTHPLNVVGPAGKAPAESKAVNAEPEDRSKMLTHPLNVVGPAEQMPTGSQTATAVEVRLTQEGGAQSATLVLGQKLVVAIAGNPSTGYQWELVGPVDGAVFEQEGRAVFVAGAPDLVGAPGEYRFTFKAIGRGATSVGMKYVRSWEQDVAPAAKATVNVTVTE